MKRIFYLILGLVAAIGALANAEEAQPPRDGVFVHISRGYDDPHRLLMGLNLASMMAESRDVLVYFDIKAVEVLLKDAEDVTFAHFPSARTLLQKLRERGATLMACPGCLKVIGKTKDDLLEGVEIAEKDRFFTFTRGRILSLDY